MEQIGFGVTLTMTTCKVRRLSNCAVQFESPNDVADEIEKLERLKNSSAISSEEYGRLRARAIQ
jgi:hypothetical protein